MKQTRFSKEWQSLERRPRAARWTWLRLFNSFPDHPKWGLVATEAGSSRAVVIATAAKLLTVANKAPRGRGSIEDFSAAEWSVTLGIPRDETERIVAVMERIGWIEQQYLITWDEHQPSTEDPTRYQRVKDHRERKRREHESAAIARLFKRIQNFFEALGNACAGTASNRPRTSSARPTAARSARTLPSRVQQIGRDTEVSPTPSAPATAICSSTRSSTRRTARAGAPGAWQQSPGIL
jgi:hypothetical protein